MVMMKNIGSKGLWRLFRCFSFSLLVSFLYSNGVAAETLSVRLTPNPASMDDILELTLSIDTTDNYAEPEAMAPLENDFNVLSGPALKRSQHFVNGKRTGLLQWSYQLQPKRSGTLTLPGFKTTSRSKILTSRPVPISVQTSNPAAGKKDQWAFVEASVDRTEAYLQEQITLDLKLFTRAEVEGNVQFPDLEKSFIMQNVSNQRNQYRTKRFGHTYRVNQYKILLYPKTTDISEIPSIRLVGKAIIRRGGFFDPGTVKSVNVGSDAISLNILEPKKAWLAKGPWLPARQVQVREAWQPDPSAAVEAGEPLTRSVTISVTGQIANHIPALPEQRIRGIKSYPDQPETSDNYNDRDGSQAQRIEKIVYIPNQSGDIRLPEIEVPWFNTQSRRMELATLNPRQVSVKQAPGVKSVAQATQPDPAANRASTPSEAPFNERMNNFNDPLSSMPNKEPSSKGWIIGTALFFLLWVLTLIQLIISRSRTQSKQAAQDTSKQDTEEKQAFESAKKQFRSLIKLIKKKPDSPELWRKAMLAWASALHQQEFNNLETFMNELAANPLKSVIADINRALYSQNKAQSISGDTLIAQLTAHQTKVEKEQSEQKKREQKGKPLTPLYSKVKES